ncbi:hypothetical protein BS78_K304700 [Paspalum vaginatum]|uniref:CASP-like protein n=1 Tax=Paspalum vaginatum TaxID=158149 RepID=A0A9W7XAB0_9POAL|nr:hypothetical protein BS78_K304700 [Paspalum vaginatum]
MGGSSSGEVGASKAASLVFRIATVGLSLASAIMTAASTQCVYRDDGVPAGTVSYTDYGAFKYSALADLLSAVLQGVAIWLEATRKERAAKAVELIDKVVQALTSTSSALLFAVDDITSCGGPRSRGARGQRQRGAGLCDQAGAFCGRVRVSSALSLAATVSVSVSIYTRHVPVAATPAPRTPSPAYVNVGTKKQEEKKDKEEKHDIEPIDPTDKTEVKKDKKEEDEVKKDEEGKKKDEVKDKQCTQDSTCTPPIMPPPWCRCPRLTIPCDCEDPDLCGAFF